MMRARACNACSNASNRSSPQIGALPSEDALAKRIADANAAAEAAEQAQRRDAHRAG